MGSRKAKLLGARTEAHEARVCLELAYAGGFVGARRITGAADALDRIVATLWLKVYRPR